MQAHRLQPRNQRETVNDDRALIVIGANKSTGSVVSPDSGYSGAATPHSLKKGKQKEPGKCDAREEEDKASPVVSSKNGTLVTSSTQNHTASQQQAQPLPMRLQLVVKSVTTTKEANDDVFPEIRASPSPSKPTNNDSFISLTQRSPQRSSPASPPSRRSSTQLQHQTQFDRTPPPSQPISQQMTRENTVDQTFPSASGLASPTFGEQLESVSSQPRTMNSMAKPKIGRMTNRPREQRTLSTRHPTIVKRGNYVAYQFVQKNNQYDSNEYPAPTGHRKLQHSRDVVNALPEHKQLGEPGDDKSPHSKHRHFPQTMMYALDSNSDSKFAAEDTIPIIADDMTATDTVGGSSHYGSSSLLKADARRDAIRVSKRQANKASYQQHQPVSSVSSRSTLTEAHSTRALKQSQSTIRFLHPHRNPVASVYSVASRETPRLSNHVVTGVSFQPQSSLERATHESKSAKTLAGNLDRDSDDASTITDMKLNIKQPSSQSRTASNPRASLNTTTTTQARQSYSNVNQRKHHTDASQLQGENEVASSVTNTVQTGTHSYRTAGGSPSKAHSKTSYYRMIGLSSQQNTNNNKSTTANPLGMNGMMIQNSSNQSTSSSLNSRGGGGPKTLLVNQRTSIRQAQQNFSQHIAVHYNGGGETGGVASGHKQPLQNLLVTSVPPKADRRQQQQQQGTSQHIAQRVAKSYNGHSVDSTPDSGLVSDTQKSTPNI